MTGRIPLDDEAEARLWHGMRDTPARVRDALELRIWEIEDVL